MTTFNYDPLGEATGGEAADMELRLWDYIDGTSNAEEKSFIEQLIATSLEWKAKYQELLEVHQLVGSHIDLNEPSMRFTRNVMEEIGKYHIAPAAKSYINKKIIWGIAIFFFAMIAGLLIYGVGQINWASDTGSGSMIPYEKIPRFDWSVLLNNTYTNVFLMVIVVLGLMMLDMYFGKKRKQLREKES